MKCDALRDLVMFLHFKKPLHGCFPRFLKMVPNHAKRLKCRVPQLPWWLCVQEILGIQKKISSEKPLTPPLHHVKRILNVLKC